MGLSTIFAPILHRIHYMEIVSRADNPTLYVFLESSRGFLPSSPHPGRNPNQQTLSIPEDCNRYRAGISKSQLLL
jgi:hypothetical protein